RHRARRDRVRRGFHAIHRGRPLGAIRGPAGAEWRGAWQQDALRLNGRARSCAFALGLLVAAACTATTPQGPLAATEREGAARATRRDGGAATAVPRPMRMSIIGRSIQQLPVSVAEATGIMAEEGLQLGITYMSSATLTTAAVMNDEIDLLS